MENLADFVELVQCIKKSAVEAVAAEKPCSVHFGTVTNTEPLKITIDQRLTLEAEQLILTRNVTEHQIEMTVDHQTEDETNHIHSVIDTFTGGGTSAPTSHLHKYKGRKIFIAHKGLIVGEKVILLRMQGGQRYIVIDRVG